MIENGDKSGIENGPKRVHAASGEGIFGKPVDDFTRCEHYRLPEDIIAIKFKCCDHYYPCYFCHQETTDHEVRRWEKEDARVKGVLCGACGYEMTIEEYLKSDNTCPACSAAFNPRCRNHYHFYFDPQLIPGTGHRH